MSLSCHHNRTPGSAAASTWHVYVNFYIYICWWSRSMDRSTPDVHRYTGGGRWWLVRRICMRSYRRWCIRQRICTLHACMHAIFPSSWKKRANHMYIRPAIVRYDMITRGVNSIARWLSVICSILALSLYLFRIASANHMYTTVLVGA
jgi:hypothetical protein